MLFQNWCVVPFGMTAIVSVFLSFAAVRAIRSAHTTTGNRNLCISFLDYWIIDTTNNFDIDFHLVTRLQEPRRVSRKADAGRRAGCDHIAGFERNGLG